MKSFDYGLVKDPHYFRDGRLDAHSDHPFYASATDYETGENRLTESLNGLWKFHYARNYESTIQGFEAENYDCHSWEDIHVPAHIEMEGYGNPQYVNIQYPWEGSADIRPGEIPTEFNPVGSYVKYITIPEEMVGKRLFICFNGVESGMALWLNGSFVGYSEDSFTPSEFELTEYVKEGVNKLAVQVFKWTSGSWCEDQDFFRFFGIFRDVYLFSIPEVHVRDLRIRTILNKELTSAELEVVCKTWGKGSAKATLSYKGEICLCEKVELNGDDTYSWKVERPHLWSAEVPDLYDLVIEVMDEKGECVEYIPEKVGFRRFEMDGSLMKINGKRIVFKGVNRHEFSSQRGRIVSEEELRKDIITMKRNNINALRTCHYPNNSMVYRLCDEYGLYMIDETNLETHGTWDTYASTHDYDYLLPKDNQDWQDLILDRAESMYERDKNHPAIIIWSCGNESFGGKDIFEMSEYFRKVDPYRLVHYENINNDRSYPATSDMESQMYTSVEDIKKFLSRDSSKPLILCEYAHAMGNSCGAMHKYTDYAYEEPLYQGGFIWDYIDQTITKKDRYGRPYQAYGGDFDDRPTDYSFSADGIVYGGDREPSPKMQEVKFNYQGITAEIDEEIVRVINRNLFVNTDEYTCVVTLAKNGKEVRKAKLETDVEPLSQKDYALPFEKAILPGEYTITVSFSLKEDTLWANAGYEVAFGQHTYTVEGEQKVCALPVELILNKHDIGVKGENFHAIFSVGEGGLVSYKYGGKEMLEEKPLPNFWRAPTDNDRGNLYMQRYAQWKIASLYVTHKDYRKGHIAEVNGPEVKRDGNTVTVTYIYTMPTVPVSTCTVTYAVYGDGTIHVTLAYDPVKGLGDMPEFGMLFRMHADYDHVEWYGLGPEETYWDRQRGGKLGIWKNLVKDNMAKYIVPQECGAKEGVRYAKVTDALGRGLLFAMDEESGPMLFSALPYSPHELEEARHPFDLPNVHHTFVRCAMEQMGVAGDNSWGALTHDEYLLQCDEKMEFSFSFKGI